MSDELQDKIQGDQAACDAISEEQLDQAAGGRNGQMLRSCPKCGQFMVRSTSTPSSGGSLVGLRIATFKCTNSACGYEEPCLDSTEIDRELNDKMF